MQLYVILNNLLKLIEIYPENKETQNFRNKFIIDKNNQVIKVIFTINDNQQFEQYINEALTLLQKQTYLSKETTSDFIMNQLIISKIENDNYTIDNSNKFIQEFLSLEIKTTQVITNIIGIELKNNQKPFQMGYFEVGYNRDIINKIKQNGGQVDNFLQKENQLYFKANIHHLDLRDKHHNKKISLYTLDFIRLLLFISGSFNYDFKIKTGSIFYNEIGNLLITDFYQQSYFNADWQKIGGSEGKQASAKLPISALISLEDYEQFKILWDLYQQKSENLKLTDIQDRILSASLAIGESIRSEEDKNALIYTCIALESLFSFDEGQLFQRSIGDKIADCLAFIVGNDKEGRKGIIKHTKEIYRARCALVHGSQSSKPIDLYWINDFIRTAIIELLRNTKYKDIKTIDQLYNMVKDAQLSY